MLFGEKEIEIHITLKTVIIDNNQSHVILKTKPNKAKVNMSANILSASQSNPTCDHTYFHNKILDQYPNLYREFSSKGFNYYIITDKTSYLLCKLDHNDEESIEGRYKSGSYFIKCKQREIVITV
ncbi:hypothetical protein C1645_811633 [Glomus cerebriforme]|uniref:Uncharacterized protein n=1 Tax=Glomus cerebriforme TaxID=658196 RepID=A0A397TMA8_9GLOM|nr:hypothetical protein C1645_811633 [Glomus cerebriforme]